MRSFRSGFSKRRSQSTARIEGETFPFSTNHYKLEIGERYYIVYEKIETKTGELGIKIYDTIS